MSVVKDTLKDIELNRIPGRIALYEALISQAESMFELNGKNLEQACKEHATNLMNMGITLQECKTIEHTIRMKIEELEGVLYRKYNEGMSRALSATDIKHYMRGDPQYVLAQTIYLEVIDVKQKLEAIVNALTDMGWMLSHITKLRVAELSHVDL